MKYEKQLLDWEWPTCPELEQRASEAKDKRTRYHYHRIRAEIVELGGIKNLGLTVFNQGGAPKYRFWQSENQMGMQVWQTCPMNYSSQYKPGKMYQSCIDSVYSAEWYSKEDIFYGLPEEEQLVKEFTKIDNEPCKALTRYQQKIRQGKIDCRDDKKRQEIAEWLEDVEEPGKEFEAWCIENIFKEHRFFFYEASSKKLRAGVCSHCGKESALEGVKDKCKIICPNCGSELRCFSKKRLNNGQVLTARDQVILHQKQGEFILARKIATVLRIANTKPTGEFYQRAHSAVFYSPHSYLPVAEFSTHENVKVTYKGFAKTTWADVNGRQCPFYAKEIREGMGLRAEIEKLCNGGLTGSMEKIMQEASRPEMEYLIKKGMTRLAQSELATGYGSCRCLFKGKTAKEILGIPPEEIEKFRRADGDNRTLAFVRSLYKCGVTLKTEDMEDVYKLRLGQSSADAFLQLQEGSSPRKALNYLIKQKAKSERTGQDILNTWRDYLRMAAAIGWNTEDKVIFMPKNLDEAHTAATASKKAVEDRKTSEGVKKKSAELQGLCWKFNGLTIRPAESQKEIIAEGAALHHCVGRNGYDKKMANGETAIFFIRKDKEQETPYVTLELNLRSGQVCQCYGDHDKYPGDKVKAFYKKWEQEIAAPALNKNKEEKSA